MRKLFIIALLLLSFPLAATAKDCKATYGNGNTVFTLATGSPGELGLLEALADKFNSTNDTTMCWKKAGSGKSLKLLKAGKADIIMVHAPAAEKKAVADGWAGMRTLIGSNEFYVVGPVADPANITKAQSVAEAYGQIAKAGALFYSRGDNSGTHKKELRIWKKANITPEGKWYQTTHEFMQATLLKADRNKGYFMTDSSTWVATKKDIKNLKVLFKGDPMLINTYHALLSPTGPHAKVTKKFIELLKGEEGQNLLRNFGKAEHGEAMYNDAVYASQYDH